MPDILNYTDIIKNIRGNIIKNLYLFYGPEVLLINEAIAAIHKKLINPSFDSLNFIKLEGPSATADAIINACETLPFFDQRKIVLVNDCDFLKGKTAGGEDAGGGRGAEELIKYLSNIPRACVLIFTAGDSIDKRKKIYNAIKKNGDIVEFDHLKTQELLSWIAAAFKKSGKKISRADALYLSENISGDLENFSREIDKVCSFAGARPDISKDDIDSVVSKSLESNIFKLVDYVSSRRPDRALSILNDLILSSEPIPVILTMIIRQYRLLLNIKLLQEKGFSAVDISHELKLKQFVVNNLYKISRNYTSSQIEERLNQCLEADIAIKNGKMNPRYALESLIVTFSK